MVMLVSLHVGVPKITPMVTQHQNQGQGVVAKRNPSLSLAGILGTLPFSLNLQVDWLVAGEDCGTCGNL